MDLNTITDILGVRMNDVDNLGQLDLSMFPEELHAEIFAGAAEKALIAGDKKRTIELYRKGNSWVRRTQLGEEWYESKEDHEIGLQMLVNVAYHGGPLPRDLAIKVADSILNEKTGYIDNIAAKVLLAGGAKDVLEQKSRLAYEKGDIKLGGTFAKSTELKFSPTELSQFALAAMANSDMRGSDILDFYEKHDLDIGHDTAVDLIKGHLYWFEYIRKFAESKNITFDSKDLKEFADGFFKQRNFSEALNLYKEAGDSVEPTEYKTKGELILSLTEEIEGSSGGWSGQLFPTVESAYEYLCEHSIDGAKAVISKYADDLLEKEDIHKSRPNFVQFGEIYKMLELTIPPDKALVAAGIAEERKSYRQASGFYSAANRSDDVRRMAGLLIDTSDEYGAQEAFACVGKEYDSVVAQFIEKNLSHGPFRLRK